MCIFEGKVEILCNPPTTSKPKKRVYCYNRADWISFHEEVNELSRHYYELNEQGQISVEDNWNYIRDNLSKAIDTYIPVKFCSDRTDAPWMTSQIKRLIRKKQRFYNKAKRSKLTSDWNEYRSVQTQVHRSIRTEHQKHIAKILNSSNNFNHNKPF